jgi:hypothetical protein
MSTIANDLKNYGLNLHIFSVNSYNSAERRYEKSIIQASHAGEALEIFYENAETDSLGRWPIPMSIDHVGELENPK